MTMKRVNNTRIQKHGFFAGFAIGALLVAAVFFTPASAQAGWLPRPEYRPPTTSTACLITRFAPDALASAPASRPVVVSAAAASAVPQDQKAITRRRSLS
jgi:hypothetical protein